MFDRQGFTLIEVLVSVFILTVCLVPLSACIVDIHKDMLAIEREQVALNLAQGKLEEIIGYEFENIKSVPRKEPFPPPHNGFSYSVRVTQDTGFHAGPKYITVTVFYATPGGEVAKCVEVSGARASR